MAGAEFLSLQQPATTTADGTQTATMPTAEMQQLITTTANTTLPYSAADFIDLTEVQPTADDNAWHDGLKQQVWKAVPVYTRYCAQLQAELQQLIAAITQPLTVEQSSAFAAAAQQQSTQLVLQTLASHTGATESAAQQHLAQLASSPTPATDAHLEAYQPLLQTFKLVDLLRQYAVLNQVQVLNFCALHQPHQTDIYACLYDLCAADPQCDDWLKSQTLQLLQDQSEAVVQQLLQPVMQQLSSTIAEPTIKAECSICHRPPVQPTTLPCSHQVCYNCLLRYSIRHHKCLECNATFSVEQDVLQSLELSKLTPADSDMTDSAQAKLPSSDSTPSQRHSMSSSPTDTEQLSSDGDDEDDKVKGHRVSCHQCKTTKFESDLLFCTTGASKGLRKRRCRKKVCMSCMRRSYGVGVVTPAQRKTWRCPSCLGNCTCAACQRRKVRVAPAIDPSTMYNTAPPVQYQFQGMSPATATAMRYDGPPVYLSPMQHLQQRMLASRPPSRQNYPQQPVVAGTARNTSQPPLQAIPVTSLAPP